MNRKIKPKSYSIQIRKLENASNNELKNKIN
jgi:hypothetical protein